MTGDRRVGADEARRKFRDLLDEVAKGAHITVERNGKPVAAVVPLEWLEQARKALSERGNGR